MAAPLIAAGAVSVAKLLKMLNSASKTKKGKHDPKEMWGEDGKDLPIKDLTDSTNSTKTYIKDEKVIDKQKLDEQEEIIRRLTK